MTLKEAINILDIKDGDTKESIKKKYRKAISKIHPDVNPKQENCNMEEVHLVNEAYHLLMKFDGDLARLNSSDDFARKVSLWNTRKNEYAYMDREIFQSMEDYDGNIIGSFSVAKGKYMWDMELEEFPLFLSSIHNCLKELSGDKNLELEEQAQLAYLLASQFIDYSCMDQLIKDKRLDKIGAEIYYLKAMVELEMYLNSSEKEGDYLFPAYVKNRRLYVKTTNGRQIGYLSFQDNRLYYYLIPLFEQHCVQVKIQISKEQKNFGGKSKNGRSLLVDLWIKRVPVDTTEIQKSINRQIEEILDKA